jgi:hypothetical protein
MVPGVPLLLHLHPGRSRSQRRPRAVRPSDPSIHPQDRKPATVPRGQPSGAKASPELGMVSPDTQGSQPRPKRRNHAAMTSHFHKPAIAATAPAAANDKSFPKPDLTASLAESLAANVISLRLPSNELS